MENEITTELTNKSIERMVSENYNEMTKKVETPYPNIEVRVLSLSNIPTLKIKNRTYISSDELRIQRLGNKRKKIRINCIRSTREGWVYSAWWLKFKEGGKEYDYFNKLLEEASL